MTTKNTFRMHPEQSLELKRFSRKRKLTFDSDQPSTSATSANDISGTSKRRKGKTGNLVITVHQEEVI